ncbi:fimbrial protein [Caballeronia sp. GAWG1-1]|uniref:fimbrial protein n=1 Tax=Caballeronia sp. GAWG1-1 TaxID=2921742 RepID=UPI0020287FA8|nr:fimbrial protein [Caballeronia sp. GAWG1-1]
MILDKLLEIKTSMNRFNTIARAVARHAAAWLMLAGMIPSAAWASASCHSNYSAFTLSFPSTIAVARDLPDGSLLSAWSVSAATPNYWTCTVSDGWYTGTDFELAGIVAGAPTRYKAPYNGVEFSVYATNVPGIGIALGGTVYAAKTQYGPWDFPVLGYERNNVGSPVDNGGQLIAALVKIGDVTPGTVSGLIARAFSWETAGKSPPGYNAASGSIDFNMTPVIITVLTCRTPDVTVPMGTLALTDLPALGPAPRKSASFNMSFDNCPAGTSLEGTTAGMIHSVQYRIDPANGTVSGFSNVAALSGTPSAGGVGVQLFDSAGAAIPFGTNLTLNGFNGAVASSYTVAMTARYYRTGPLSPGPANTTMTMTMYYQ